MWQTSFLGHYRMPTPALRVAPALHVLAAGSVGHPGVLGTRLLFVVASGSVRLSPSSILVSERQTRPQLRSQIEDQL